MDVSISGKEYPLKKIFSSDFEYHIPVYQRPYAWEEEQAEALINDLIDFYESEKDENYFLGSVVLVKDNASPFADVIDGQQRLTTLTILLAVIASKLTEVRKHTCVSFIVQPADGIYVTYSVPRLYLREQDQAFFKKYVQDVDIDNLVALDVVGLKTESQKHIVENAMIMKKKLESEFGNDEDKYAKFLGFLGSRCYLVSVSTPSKQSAFRVFSVMNNRGLDLMASDIIKAEIIGKIDESLQDDYTNKWEEIEIDTTRNGFNDVFTHTRMIFAATKAKKTLVDEFKEHVSSKMEPMELIDTVIGPYAKSYTELKNRSYKSSKNADIVNQYLMWLNKIDNSDWMPSAIKFLTDNRTDPDYVLWFFGKLECLASYLHLTAKNVNERIERYALLLEEMKQPHCITDKITTVELTDKEKEEFLEVISGDIYCNMTGKRRNYLLLRLDSMVADGAASYDPKKLTIEHVLPQTVSEGSEWAKLWPDEQVRKYWLHKIANLVPLTKNQNSKAQNFDFDVKKNSYFKSKDGTVSYTLTSWVIGKNEWTENIVKTRQEELISKFKEVWGLDSSAVRDKIASINLAPGQILVRTTKRGADAFAILETSGKIVVLAESRVSYDTTDSLADLYRQERENFKASGKIVARLLTENIEFDSPSRAACIVLGRPASGSIEWEEVKRYAE